MQTAATFLIDAFRRYRDQWQGEAALITRFEIFLHAQTGAFERGNRSGHFTGSAWLVSADGMRVLLMHHRKLDRWLQPGGHADGDADLARAGSDESYVVNAESHALAWRPVGEVANDESLDMSLRRMARKWLKPLLQVFLRRGIDVAARVAAARVA